VIRLNYIVVSIKFYQIQKIRSDHLNVQNYRLNIFKNISKLNETQLNLSFLYFSFLSISFIYTFHGQLYELVFLIIFNKVIYIPSLSIT